VTRHKGVSTGGGGFTLVEAAVALAILALALGAIYQSFAWSLSRTAVLNEQQAAVATAQSVLAELRSRHALKGGELRGSTNEMEWLVTTHERDVSTSAHSFPLFDVTVQVSWGKTHSKHVEIRSVEVGWPSHA
jgi:type II secretory pathway pseudopilin PulG